MCPSTPLSVNSGRKPAMMMPAAKKMERLTSAAAIDALHHDDGGIDDQAEIDRADRKQVGRLTPEHEDADREEQCERYGGGDDQRTAQIAEEDPLQDEDQQDTGRHIVQDRPR